MVLAIFNIGPTELIVILVLALILFGGRLPDVARSLGRSFTQFKRGLRDVEDEMHEVSRDVNRIESPQPPRSLPRDAGAAQGTPQKESQHREA